MDVQLFKITKMGGVQNGFLYGYYSGLIKFAYPKLPTSFKVLNELYTQGLFQQIIYDGFEIN